MFIGPDDDYACGPTTMPLVYGKGSRLTSTDGKTLPYGGGDIKCLHAIVQRQVRRNSQGDLPRVAQLSVTMFWRIHTLTSSSDRNQKMSNSLTQLVSVFNGTNYMTWGLAMKNYLLSQGQWRNAIIKPFPEKIYPQKEVRTKGPKGGEDVITLVDDLSQNHLNYDNIESWIENNDKARCNIMLQLHNVIAEKFYAEEHASSIWEALEKEYGKPGIATIYQEFTGAMTTTIPNNSDPSFALEKIVSHFTWMATSKCVLPEHLKAMILISKMPPSMTALIQLVCQTDDINKLNCDKIKKMIIHGWEQKLSNRSTRPQQPQAARKISAIQRSGPPVVPTTTTTTSTRGTGTEQPEPSTRRLERRSRRLRRNFQRDTHWQEQAEPTTGRKAY